MRKILFMVMGISIIGLWFASWSAAVSPEDKNKENQERIERLHQERKEKIKRNYDFAHWPGKQGLTIECPKISKEMFPGLVSAETFKSYTGHDLTGKFFKMDSYSWRTKQGSEFYLSIVTAPSALDAQEYLIERWSEFSNQMPFLYPRFRKPKLPFGDICFGNIDQKHDFVKSAYMVRNNIVIEIDPKGDFMKFGRDVLKQIDDLLVAAKKKAEAKALPPKKEEVKTP